METSAKMLPHRTLRVPRFNLNVQQLVVIGMVLVAFAAIFAMSIVYSSEAVWVPFVPFVAIAFLLVLWMMKRAIEGSRGAVIGYLVLLVFITDAQFRARGAGEIDTDWQSVMKFALWIGAGVIGYAHTPPIRSLLSHPGSALWLIYITIAMISSAYAPTPAYSFGCAFSLLCFFTFAFALIKILSEEEFLWTMMLTFAAFLAVGWIVYFKDPTLGTSEFWTYNGIELRMCGIAGQANNLGSVCAKYLGAIFLLWTSSRCRLIYALPLAALGVASLMASDARTGMIAAVVAMVVATLAQSFRGLIAAALVAVTGLIATIVFSVRLDALGSSFSRSGDPTEVFTLTGRLEIWDFVEEEILQKPFLGWGYNASKTLLPQHVTFQDGLMVDTAHNMLLQSLLSVGLAGTIPIILVVLYLFFNLLYRPNRFRDLFFVVIFISGISDTSALGTTPSILTLLFLVISILPQGAARPRLTDTAWRDGTKQPSLA
jgi:exopolysaccharide production protein ExoQ